MFDVWYDLLQIHFKDASALQVVIVSKLSEEEVSAAEKKPLKASKTLNPNVHLHDRNSCSRD